MSGTLLVGCMWCYVWVHTHVMCIPADLESGPGKGQREPLECQEVQHSRQRAQPCKGPGAARSPAQCRSSKEAVWPE